MVRVLSSGFGRALVQRRRRAALVGWMAASLLSAPAVAGVHFTQATASLPDFPFLDDAGTNGATVSYSDMLGIEMYSASSGVSYGSVGARAAHTSTAFSRSLTFGAFIASATAQSVDQITILGGTGAGTLDVTFSTHGTGFENNPTLAAVDYLFAANTASPTQGNTSFVQGRATNGLIDGPVTADPIPFVFAEPFTLSLTLEAYVVQTGNPGPPPFTNVTASIDYLNTIAWTGAEVFDAQGLPVPGFTIVSASGTSYPLAVPEPGAWALALVGAGVLGAFWRPRGS